MAIVGADSASGDPVSQHIELLKGVERMANTNRDVANSVNNLRNVVVEIMRKSESSTDKLRSSMEHQMQAMIDHFKGVEAKKLLESTNEQSEAVAKLTDKSTPKADKISESINKEISELAETSSKLTTLLEKSKGGNISESIDKMLTNNQKITAIEAALNSIANSAVASAEAQLQSDKIDQQRIDAIYTAIEADREARAKALEIQQKEDQKAQTLEEKLTKTRRPERDKSGRNSLLGMFGSLLGVQKGFHKFASGIFGKMLFSLGKAALTYELVETGIGLLRLIARASDENEKENRADTLKSNERYDNVRQQAYKTNRKNSGKAAPKIDALFESTIGFGNIETVREAIKTGKIDLDDTQMTLGIAKRIALNEINKALSMIKAIANKNMLVDDASYRWDRAVNWMSGTPLVGGKFMAKESRFTISEWCQNVMANASKAIEACKTPGEVQSTMAEIIHQIMMNGSVILQVMSNGKNFLTEQHYEQLASQTQEASLAIAEFDPVTSGYAAETKNRMMGSMQEIQSKAKNARIGSIFGDWKQDKNVLIPADHRSPIKIVTKTGEAYDTYDDDSNLRALLEKIITGNNLKEITIGHRDEAGLPVLLKPVNYAPLSNFPGAQMERWDSEGKAQSSMVVGQNEIYPASPFNGMTEQQKTDRMLDLYNKGDQQFKQDAAEGKFGSEMQELVKQLENLNRNFKLLGQPDLGQRTELDKVVGALRDVVDVVKHRQPASQPVNINMSPMVKTPAQPQRR